MEITLAEALLRRKELNDKVAQLKQVKTEATFEVKARRQQVTDSLEDIQMSVPKLTVSQLTEEYDYYARQLRLLDAVIQQANWTTKIQVDKNATSSFSEKS